MSMHSVVLPLSLASSLLLLGAACKSPSPSKLNAVPMAEDSSGQALGSLAVQTAAPAAAQAPAQTSGRVTTPSGLQYQVLTSGPAGGQSPSINDSVTVHYRGTLTDGTVFDSSIDRRTPATFGVGQVIPGWTEALQMMKPGDMWVLYIPSHLAYGSRAVGAKIPPNSDLIFHVQLLSVSAGR